MVSPCLPRSLIWPNPWQERERKDWPQSPPPSPVTTPRKTEGFIQGRAKEASSFGDAGSRVRTLGGAQQGCGV